MKKKFLKLSVVCVAAMGLASSLSAKALSDAEVANLIKGNTMLNNQIISVKKAEKVSDNLTTMKLGIQYQTQQGIQERPAQAFLANIDGKSYTFLGGGFDDKGEKIALSLNEKVVNEGVAWSAGKGKEVLYVVTNPSCSWCVKLEEESEKSKTFLEKYTVKKIIMPFFENAKEKTIWILAGKNDAEKAERYKKVMVDKDNTWQSFKPSADELAKIEKLLEKSLEAAKELDAQGTPAVFDSKFQPINNWPELIK